MKRSSKTVEGVMGSLAGSIPVRLRKMCLLIVLARTHPESPLVVAANRDELYGRPAVAMTLLQESGPRILGGRDELAGGTWLAVNEFGVVAGLTNRPATTGRDPSKRSRGELPLALASHASAAQAVEAFVAAFDPSDYNPAWLLVGDRDQIYTIDMTGEGSPAAERLRPGVHILENRPLGAPSSKVSRVRELVAGVEALSGEALTHHLQTVLTDHEIPPPLDGDPAADTIPGEVRAACVHYRNLYGTRWSGVITVPPERGSPPKLRYSDGPACRGAYVDASPLWGPTGVVFDQ